MLKILSVGAIWHGSHCAGQRQDVLVAYSGSILAEDQERVYFQKIMWNN